MGPSPSPPQPPRGRSASGRRGGEVARLVNDYRAFGADKHGAISNCGCRVFGRWGRAGEQDFGIRYTPDSCSALGRICRLSECLAALVAGPDTRHPGMGWMLSKPCGEERSRGEIRGRAARGRSNRRPWKPLSTDRAMNNSTSDGLATAHTPDRSDQGCSLAEPRRRSMAMQRRQATSNSNSAFQANPTPYETVNVVDTLEYATAPHDLGFVRGNG